MKSIEWLRAKIHKINKDMLKIIYRFTTDEECHFDIRGECREGWEEFTPEMVTEEGYKAAEIEIKEEAINDLAKQMYRVMYHSLLIRRRK